MKTVLNGIVDEYLKKNWQLSLICVEERLIAMSYSLNYILRIYSEQCIWSIVVKNSGLRNFVIDRGLGSEMMNTNFKKWL